MGDEDEARFDDAEERMRAIIASGDLPEPDEIVRDSEHRELVLLWHEQRLAVTIELDAHDLPAAPI